MNEWLQTFLNAIRSVAPGIIMFLAFCISLFTIVFLLLWGLTFVYYWIKFKIRGY